ncbi:hypothetical protein IFM89_033075 [Coptis chinensis]|uniref:Uncharacterized protein n=1 Tax=Coptis chinensis TaxID=261450 RepID=A0A835M2U9_9MAGN|nr:hypothetical protein IFM89_033075 [Coptis chinensis]
MMLKAKVSAGSLGMMIVELEDLMDLIIVILEALMSTDVVGQISQGAVKELSPLLIGKAQARFVQTYSGRCITFGKVEKQITCEITNPPKSSDLSEHSADDIHTSAPEQLLPSMEPHSYADSDPLDISLDSGDVSSSVDTDGQVNESISISNLPSNRRGCCTYNLGRDEDNENAGPKAADKIDPLPVKQQQKKPTIKKKPTVKGRSHKSPKSNIPGSAKRLKVKEKAILADVFSKYGEKDVGDSSKKSSRLSDISRPMPKLILQGLFFLVVMIASVDRFEFASLQNFCSGTNILSTKCVNLRKREREGALDYIAQKLARTGKASAHIDVYPFRAFLTTVLSQDKGSFNFTYSRRL